MPEKTESQQNAMDDNVVSCHDDAEQSLTDFLDDCCQDMSSCSTSVSYVPSLSLMQMQVVHASVQLPAIEAIVFNSSSPPKRPPKTI